MFKSPWRVALLKRLAVCSTGIVSTGIVSIGIVSFASAPSQAAVDPTRPPAQSHNSVVSMDLKANPWQLQAIRISAQGRYALINGIRVRLGESISSAEVMVIEPGSVVLKQGNRRISLTLGSLINIKRNSQEVE